MIEKIKSWVEELAGSEDVGLDALSRCGQCAVFPLGTQLIGRKPDILGGEQRRYRYTMLLATYHQRDPLTGDTEAYMRLERLAERMKKMALADGGDAAFRAEKAHLKSMTKEGLARYEMKVIFEYTTEE